MRIVAGVARGRRIEAPPGDGVRPTADRVREALFSSLQARLPGARVLDLFAGSGALGLEASSRGAAHVTLVERDRRALQVLRRNVQVVNLPGIEVVAGEVVAVLNGVGLSTGLVGSPFDLVLADPPYRLAGEQVEVVLSALVRHLAPGAVVVVERSAREEAFAWPAGLEAGEPRRYGATMLHRAELVA